jgi:two-component system chemotaxis response regulator CheY
MKICLVVDDSSVIRKVARRILEGPGLPDRRGRGRRAGARRLPAQLPDAILLDWNMPKMDGYEFLKALRRLPDGDPAQGGVLHHENDVATSRARLHAGRTSTS